ncbi:Chromatin assembly factor 1 subunit fas1 [Thalictrum thalictroides]|uniref:Chromatin assembly factor 1 subunit fas1 n=1 Tax=Thalictrum thalictroides TaxID=46969 RepID=A0A7J6V856_THATH|nr:Chromatin assembly factor 1 subunit fas1 [Thalictrum thalictroides]
MIAALQELDIHSTQKLDLMKASEKLAKVLNEAEIRKFVENMVQKTGVELAEKEAKLKEKVVVKELEKEKKRMEREHLKEKLQIEREKWRLQDEAEKAEKLGDAERKKLNKRQQEGDQRRREKEEAQLKKQLLLKKQANLMERFFIKKTTNSGHQDDISSTKDMISDSPGKGDIKIGNAVTLSMDATFSLKDDMDTCDLYRLHCDAWNKLGCSIHSGDSRHWGMRQKPKIALIKELKLQGSSSEPGESVKLTTANLLVRADMLNVEKAVDGLVDNIPDDRLCLNNGDRFPTDIHMCNRTKKLLQFDKSHRPAYYGTLSAKSDVIGPRHPFKKDPNLDYDVESDEEWEEEDPGESLSDCDKDDEEENLVEGNVRADDEGSEDGFLVPDGYLSENEGVQVDSKKTEGDPGSTPQCKQDSESEEFRALFRQQKHIHNLTEQALQKNQPLIVSNLMYEKTTLLTAKDLNGTLKLEQMFLQALSLQPFPGGTPIEISADYNTIDEDQDIEESHCSGGNASGTPVANMLDKDLVKIVFCIQECSNGINNIIESLQQSFPASPKTQLRNKVREIADFVDNRWQVKKEILEKLGLSASPEKSGERTRGIAAFFSKRCLPPTGDPIKIDQISPCPCHKPEMCFHE